MDITKVLPIDCISKIISLTSPKDACGWCCVSYAFKEAADSDIAWESFLPSGYRHIISQSSSPNRTSLSAKQIYFLLHHHFILLANDTLSFSLTKEDRRCYIMGAKALSIHGSDNPLHWNWTSIPTSRFPQVAELNRVEHFDVKGSLKTKLLSPKTIYDVFFIFKFGMNGHGLSNRFLNFNIRDERGVLTSDVGVRFDLALYHFITQRENEEWMELWMGNFCVFDEDEDGLVECRIWETSRNPKRGLVVEGFEFRPTTKKWGRDRMCKRHRFSCH